MGKLILIGGGSCSGKTTLAERIKQAYKPKAMFLSMDNFYRGSVFEEKIRRGDANFDQPQAIDFPLLEKTLAALLAGTNAEIPKYDFSTHKRTDETITLEPAELIIVEGIFALYDKRMLETSRFSIYVDCGIDIMIRRRIERDRKYRGREVRDVLKQFFDTVLPMYYEYVEPTKDFADVVADGEQGVEDVFRQVEAGGIEKAINEQLSAYRF